MTVQTILKQALKLPKRSRIRIAEQLFESTLDDNVLKAGAQIAEQRRRAFERGEIGAKPLGEVIKRLRKRQPGQQVLMAGALKEITAAAQLANKRIKACRSGKMKTVEEEEIMDLLRTKSSS